MAKQITWRHLKEKLTRFRWVDKFNEQDLTAHLRNGSEISLRGADNQDSLRGVGLHFLAVDEAADIAKTAWTEVLRPTLSDTGGEAMFLGSPKGRNWFYDLYMLGQTGADGWASWQYTTLEGGNVPAEEVAAARRDLDDLTFAQEYEASFVNFEGRCYYPFTVEANVGKLVYDVKQPISICLDFNVSPGIAVIAQEMVLPNGESGTGAIGEVYIPRNSNTPAVCRKILADYGKHKGAVNVYGDATGGASGSAKVMGSDWDLVKQALRPLNPRYHIPKSNPAERARVNAVNSRLRAADGTRRFYVDAGRCPKLIRDLEGVRLLKGGAGEIDKKGDAELTHLTDALGYYIEREFSTNPRTVAPSNLIGV